MHIRRISVAKYPYPYPFKQGNYYPYPIRIRENCGYPQNIYPRIHIRDFWSSCSLSTRLYGVRSTVCIQSHMSSIKFYTLSHFTLDI